METITFDNVVPHVFAHQEKFDSDIWKSCATFEKDKLYLVEAERAKVLSVAISSDTGMTTLEA